jgi:hypothetical protein
VRCSNCSDVRVLLFLAGIPLDPPHCGNADNTGLGGFGGFVRRVLKFLSRKCKNSLINALSALRQTIGASRAHPHIKKQECR